jgi:hypothetical protein
MLLAVSTLWAAGRRDAGFEGPEPPVGFGNLPDALPDTGSVNYVDYDIGVRLVPVRHYLEGTTRIVFRSRVSRLGQIDLVIYNDTLRILRVMHGAQALPYTYNPSTWVLSVGLYETLGLGDEDTIAVEYSGYITPALSSALSNYCRLDGAIGFSVLPYVWFPAPFDHYYANRRDDRFTCRTTITTPRYWRSVGVGALADSAPTGTSETYAWQTTRPVTLVVFTTAPYLLSSRTFNGLSIRYYDSDTSSAARTFAAVGSILDYMTRSFGPCSLEKLAYAENYQAYGAAARSLVMMPLPYQLSGLTHETSHQWWGVSLTLRYATEVWLNEGFASYSEVLFQEDSFGLAVRRAELDTMAWRYLAVPRNQDRAIIPAPTGSNYYFTIVYNKGAWVLHMLRWVLGDSTFFRVMNTYATSNRDSSVTVDAFRQVAEQVSGRPLSWFFNEWLYGVGAPAYSANWQSESLGPGNSRLTVVVRQTDAIFDMPLPLSVFSSAGRRDTSIWVSRLADTAVLAVPVTPDSVVLDHDDWVLDRGIHVTEVLESPKAAQPRLPMPTIFRGILQLHTAAPAQLLDLSGRNVLDLAPGPNDVSRLSPGVYFIVSERPVLRQRVVVVQ